MLTELSNFYIFAKKFCIEHSLYSSKFCRSAKLRLWFV
jgi:hypothetical protein